MDGNAFRRSLNKHRFLDTVVHQDTYREINEIIERQTEDGYVPEKVPFVALIEKEFSPFVVKEE